MKNYIQITKADESIFSWKAELCAEDGTVLGLLPLSGFSFSLEVGGLTQVVMTVPDRWFRTSFMLDPSVIKFVGEKLQETPLAD